MPAVDINQNRLRVHWPDFTSARPRSLESAARRRARAGRVARIPYDAIGYQPVPNEQHKQRADGRADETRALVEPVPTDGLADERCDERAGDPEPGRQYEAGRAIRTGRDETRDDAADEADHDNPDNVVHDDLPLPLAAGPDRAGRQGPRARPGTLRLLQGLGLLPGRGSLISMRIHEPLELLAIPGVTEIFHEFREFALGGDELLAFFFQTREFGGAPFIERSVSGRAHARTRGGCPFIYRKAPAPGSVWPVPPFFPLFSPEGNNVAGVPGFLL